MRFINNFFFTRELRNSAWTRFRDEKSEIRCVDLDKPKYIGKEWDVRRYVGRIGFFTEDMMFENIPDVTWYVRSDGNIWSEWQIRLRYRSTNWHRYKKIKPDVFRKNQEYSAPVKMTREQMVAINDFSKELWTMHKMSSGTLL